MLTDWLQEWQRPRRFNRSSLSSSKALHRNLSAEVLEIRIMPVVGKTAVADAPEPGVGTGYDGVVYVRGVNNAGKAFSGSGSLLDPGRHILTAAHNLTDDAGAYYSKYLDFWFDLSRPGISKDHTRVFIEVPQNTPGLEEYRVKHGSWNGDTTRGNDIAIVRIIDPDNKAADRFMIAPKEADRYALAVDRTEVGNEVVFAG